MGIKVDIYTRWFDKNDQQINPIPDSDNNARVIKIRAGNWEFVPKEFIYDLLPELADNMINLSMRIILIMIFTMGIMWMQVLLPLMLQKK